MKSQKINFFNKDGLKLSGYIDSPEADTPVAYAIFAHCFTCSKELKAIANIDSSLAKKGIAALRFDFRGIGESQGDFPETNYSGYLDDVLSAAEFLSENFKPPKLIIGHSLGGCAAIESASKIPSIKAIAVIGTPSEPSSLSHKLRKTKEKAESEGAGEATIGGVKFRFKKQFFDDLENHKLEPYIRNLSKPLLILHSPIDAYTPIESGEEIFKTAKHPKSFVSLDKIDHLMLNKQDAVYVGDVIALWAKKYL